MKLKNIVAVLITTFLATLAANAVDDGNNYYFTNQSLGIKQRVPTADLHLNGSALFEAGNVTITSSLTIPAGAGAGLVLTSDGSGNATWAAGGSGSADNLGDHTATTNLDMSTNDIENVGTVTADNFVGGNFTGSFFGDGSALTGVGGSDNLGDHTATTDLEMDFNDIVNVNKITANEFEGGIFTGDGSGLTGVSSSNGTINNGTINNSNIYNSYLEDAFLQDPTINGTATFTENSSADFYGDIYIRENAASGKILSSDSNGKATWITLPIQPQSNGDNLGNHTATRELNLAGNDITNAGSVSANTFVGGVFNGSFLGDGSQLTGVGNTIFTLNGNTISNSGSEASYNNDFVIGSPQLNATGNGDYDKRLLFDKAKGALRVGIAKTNAWNTNNRGRYSIAFGEESIASGISSLAAGNGALASGISSVAIGMLTKSRGAHSFAMGYMANADDNFAMAFGNTTRATGQRSTAFGYKTRAFGNGSTAFGKGTRATGALSTAFGEESYAGGTNSMAIGKFVQAKGPQAMAIGFGNSNQDMMVNNVQNSLAIGFNSNAATLFVAAGNRGSTIGKVGIGTMAPADELDVRGMIRTTGFRMTTGAANNFVLTSDGVGRGVWKSASEITGTGDNLGNHIATKRLDLANNNIINVNRITATNVNTDCITLQDGTRLCTEADLTDGRYPKFQAVNRSTQRSIANNTAVFSDYTNNELYDTHNAYDLGTGIFRAPKAGVYHFTLYVDLRGVGTNACSVGWASGSLIRNNTEYFAQSQHSGDRANSTWCGHINASGDIKLNRNDTVRARIITGESGTNELATFRFSGFLIP